MTGIPAVLLLLTGVTALATVTVPQLGAVTFLLATLTAATTWRQHARRNRTGEKPRHL